MLKARKPTLERRLTAFRRKLEVHQKRVASELQGHLDKSRRQVVARYVPRAVEDPPDAMLGQLLREEPTEDDARDWLDEELDQVFPKADPLVEKMQLDVRYKDVTFETLNRPDFLKSFEAAFTRVDWDKAYEEFRAAGEAQDDEQRPLSKPGP